MYSNVLKSYKEANYLTANPLRLVLICYDGAIRSLKLALASYKAKEYEAKGKALQKVLDIVYELNASLDMTKGGEVAKNLRSLYNFIPQALTDADLKKDFKVFEEVIHMLEELESAWKEIAGGRSENQQSIPDNMPERVKQTTVASRVWSV